MLTLIVRFRLRKIPKNKVVYFWTKHNLIYSLTKRWDVTYALCDMFSDEQVVGFAKSFEREYSIYPYGDSLFYTTKPETR